MTYYLLTDAVDDYLSTNFIIPTNFTLETELISNVTNNNEYAICAQFTLGANGRFVFGVMNKKLRVYIGGTGGGELYGTTILTTGTKYKIKLTITNRVANIYLNDSLEGTKTFSVDIHQTSLNIGRSQYNNGSFYMPMGLYNFNVKDENLNTLLFYDLNTQTVQDQSGNGNHATLIGGTWVDDGTSGGTPTGTDGTISLGLSQSIYRDSLSTLTTRQSVYADGLEALTLRQSIYEDIVSTIETVQQIYYDYTSSLNLTQSVYEDNSNRLNTLQNIYIDQSSTLLLIQQFYEDSQTFITLNQTIYKDDIKSLPTKQQIYVDDKSILSLIQQFYEDTRTFITLTLRQEIYDDNMEKLDLQQTIYNDDSVNLDMIQQMFSESYSRLNTKQEMYETRASSINLTQAIFINNSSSLSLLQAIYNDAETRIDTIQQLYDEGEVSLSLLIEMLEDFRVYRQVIEYVLQINTQNNYDMNLSSSRKNYDLKI